MQKKLNIVLWVAIILLGIGIGIFMLIRFNQMIMKGNYYFYMDTQIYVKLYDRDRKKIEQAFDKIDNLYQEYHQLTNRFEHYDGVINVYDIAHNKEETETLTLDPRLYDILKMSQEWYEKSQHKFDITLGHVIDLWKKYRDQGTGIPSSEELRMVEKSAMERLILLDQNQIQNNHLSLDLGGIAKGYATEKVGEMLKEMGLTRFVINAGGNVLVGEDYGNGDYTVGVENPNQIGDVFTIVHGTNLSIVTSGGYERFYEYEGKKYHHLIDPETLAPANYMKSVTVLTRHSALADILSTVLFLMPIEDGMTLLNELDGVEAIWYTNDDMVVRSLGVSAYETK